MTGAGTSLLSSAAVALRQRADPSFEPSVPVPDVARSSAGLAAFFALSANTRYQLLGERAWRQGLRSSGERAHTGSAAGSVRRQAQQRGALGPGP
jgi:hypothetical protein